MNMRVLSGYLAALVVIVDDAIVDVERILRRLRESSSSGEERMGAVVIGALTETRIPLFYATLIIFLLVVPVFFMMGLAKPFFGPLAFSYLLALLASTVVAMTAAPPWLRYCGAIRHHREPPLR